MIFSDGKKAFIKFGNGFPERKNKISISLKNNQRVIFKNNIFYENKNLTYKDKNTPMENLLIEFHNSISKLKNYDQSSFQISKKTTDFILSEI